MKNTVRNTMILALIPITFLMAETGRDIMIKVDKVLRESYTSTIQNVKLSTCKYIIKDQKLKCAEEARVKVLQSIQKDFGVDNKDSRSIAFILEPVSDKGIATLTYDYDDPAKDADTWIYLPAFGKVKRLLSSSEESEESGSFFGSEFSVEDMENKKIDDFTYNIIREETFDQRPVWVIESIPTERKAKKSKYSKILSWVDKERFIVLKDDMYNRQGMLYKQLTKRNIELIDNVWLARKATMINLISRRATNMELLSAAFNMPVSDEFFTQRTMTDFAFREKNLKDLRSNFK